MPNGKDSIRKRVIGSDCAACGECTDKAPLAEKTTVSERAPLAGTAPAAAGAVAAADAEVAAYIAAVACVVAEKGGLRPPFSYAWTCSLPKSARVRVYLDDVRYERSINCNERM